MVYGTLCRSWRHNLTLCRIQSRLQHMGNPMPESTVTLCQSRLYPPVRGWEFGLWCLCMRKIKCVVFPWTVETSRRSSVAGELKPSRSNKLKYCVPQSTYYTIFYIINCGFDPAFKLFDQNIYAGALIKKKTKFSSYIRKFRWDQLQSHIWGRTS